MTLPGPRQPAPAPQPRRTVLGPRQPLPIDWVEDLAHEALIGFMATHLRAAQEAAAAAEDAAARIGEARS
ncbi:hypothetical protein ABT330_33665 [Streptomyces sp. NPDC000658]|uniref:hypothetical protein n=1 Tax=Streptomyces sp. NPDC000658 TaxID=3154266 RepID=UPI003328CE70